jgi:hypothetical protein
MMQATARMLRVTAALFALGSLAGEQAWAQRRGQGGGILSGPIEFGVRGGRDFENHAWSLGGQVRVPIGQSLELRPSGDFFFPKEGKTGRQLNADAALRFGDGGFYAGGGLAFVDLAESGGKKRGHNLFFGLSDRPGKTVTSFAEFRWTFYDETSPFRLALGFNYGLATLWR